MRIAIGTKPGLTAEAYLTTEEEIGFRRLLLIGIERTREMATEFRGSGIEFEPFGWREAAFAKVMGLLE